MLRIEYQTVPRADFAVGTSRFSMDLNMRFYSDQDLMLSVSGIHLECIFDLRNWLISDFFYQKHFLMSDASYDAPIIVGLIHVPHEQGWRILGHQQENQYSVFPRIFSESEMHEGLTQFFQEIRADLRSHEVYL